MDSARTPDITALQVGSNPFDPEGEYGIAANVLEPDAILRLNAKVWLCDGTGGCGWERFIWIGLPIQGHRRIEKWVPTHRLQNFRPAWIPQALHSHINYIRGDRGLIKSVAAMMGRYAESERLRREKRDRTHSESALS